MAQSRYRACATLIGLFCLVPASASQAACTLGAVAVLPLRIDHNRFFFTAAINHNPVELQVDTGSFATMLSRPAAQRVGVRMAQAEFDAYGVGGVSHIYRGTAATMRIGQMNADGMSLAATELPNVDGLFGMNMMAAYDIDIDALGRHLIMFEADGNCDKPNVALSQPLYMAPLEFIQNERQADVEVRINGHRVRAVIDTGAARTAIFRSTANRLGVDLSGLRDAQAKGHGVGPRAVPVMTHVFEEVSIGDLTIQNMPVGILDQPGTGLSLVHVGSRLADPSLGETGGEEMLLGADFMQKVHLWISHSSHKLIMQYPPKASVPPH